MNAKVGVEALETEIAAGGSQFSVVGERRVSTFPQQLI
jgi:hypothetical protein